MQIYQVIITPTAYRDLKSIRDYIEHKLKSPQAAKKLLDELYALVSSLESLPDLESLPERYPRVKNEPWLSRGLRKVTVKNYNIYYLVDQNTFEVFITGIFYRGKNQDRALAKRNIDS